MQQRQEWREVFMIFGFRGVVLLVTFGRSSSSFIDIP
jgi:hypothetical protein